MYKYAQVSFPINYRIRMVSIRLLMFVPTVQRILMLLILIFAFNTRLNAQQLALKKSSSSASSSLMHSPSGVLTLNQIVGQSSLIGIYTQSNLQISQGFLQPSNRSIQNHVDGNFVIYPNPSSGEVNLLWNSTDDLLTQYELYNSDGKLVKTDINELGLNKLKLTELKGGLYYLRVCTKKGKLFSHKLLLK